ncbi:MAG TPA: alpha/beta hydrolase [Microlunatus sp.]
MAAGAGVAKEPGTDRFAERFQKDGFSVLAFDFRYVGESGGAPRQIVRIGDQVADWTAAIGYAATLPEVDPERIAGWGFSLAAGHLFRVAARTPGLAAVIAQSPLVDNRAAAPNALRHETPAVILRFPLVALADAIGGVFGREPRLIPLAGDRGELAMLTTPDARDGAPALNPDNRYPDWQQQIAARSVLPLLNYRPGRSVRRVRCPIQFVVCTEDRSVLAAPAYRAAEQARESELVRIPGGHYAPFLDQHEQVVAAELDFLRRQLVVADPNAPERAGPLVG